MEVRSAVSKKERELAGFAATHAMNGEEGFAHIKERTPDLILLDLIMPIMSGFEFLENVAAEAGLKEIPIFVLTNLAQPEDVKKAGTHAKKYLLKSKNSVEDIVSLAREFLNDGVPSV